MLHHPVAAGSPFFDGAIIDRLLAQCPEPDEIEAGFHIWKPYDPSLRYAIGAVQLKATAAITALPFCSTLVLFLIASRFVCKQSHPRRPVRARAEPLGDMYGTCLIGPEKNSESGGYCLASLKMIYPADWIYRQVPTDQPREAQLHAARLRRDHVPRRGQARPGAVPP
jgi:hypothetical protein